MNPRDMTNEQLRVAVAEAMGWTELHVRNEYEETGGPDGNEGSYDVFRGTIDGNEDLRVPNFPRDLNACSEFEKTLDGPAFYHYYAVLAQLCLDAEAPHFASAPARLRCLALLETLKGTRK